MSDARQYAVWPDLRKVKVKVTSDWKLEILRHLQWELVTDHGFLKYGTISKFDPARFVVFVLVFVTWLLTWQKCEESIVTPVWG